jgi:hypothetical protein
MTSRLRRALKIGGWCLGSAVAMLLAFIGLLAFPGFMFAHQMAHANLVVHSDEDLRGRIEPVLQAVGAQLADSEIDAPDINHHIFFGHDNRPFRILQEARLSLVRQATGMVPSPNYNASLPPLISHVISFDRPDPEHDLLLREAWPGRLNMTHILTHELAHTLVMQRLGVKSAAALPFWKAEGFPEFVAYGAKRRLPGYDLLARLKRVSGTNLAWALGANGSFAPLRYDCIGKSYIEDENGDQWHTCYYLARLLVEYQVDVKGVSFEELVDPTITDVDTWREISGALTGPASEFSRSR